MSTTKGDQQRVVQQQYTEAIQLLALLSQLRLTKSHDKENAPIHDIDAGNTQGPTSTPNLQEQPCYSKLLDALAFVASTRRGFTEMVAMRMDVNPDEGGFCIRIATNQSEHEMVLERVKRLEQLLNKFLSGYNRNVGGQEFIAGFIDELFDEVLRMKKDDLLQDLHGTQGTQQGLLAALRKTIETITTSNANLSVPPYSSSLRPSAAEVAEAGPYTKETHQTHMELAFTHLKNLFQLARKASNAGKGKKARTRINVPASKEFILFAHNLQSYSVTAFLVSQQPSEAATGTSQLIQRVCNYRQSCIDIVEGACTFTGVQEIKFRETPRTESMQLDACVGEKPPLVNLTELLERSGCRLQDFREFCTRFGYREKQVVTAFGQSLQQPLRIHPEISLSHYYTLHPELTLQPGMGCSSPSCYACYYVLKNHPHFRLANLKLEPQANKFDPMWGLPAMRLSAGQEDNYFQLYDRILPDLVTRLYAELRATLELRFRTRGDIVGIIGDEELNAAMQDFVLGNSSRTDDHFDERGCSGEEPDTSNARRQTKQKDIADICAGCHDVTTTRKCSKCGKIFLCSKRCEEKQEPWHIFDCKPTRPITSADRLVRYCYQDQMPENDDEVAGFGFDRCRGGEERSKLLGLYIGLVLYNEVTSRQLHQWQQQNKLAENICNVYEEMNRGGRKSGYYEWFVNNKHIVNAKTPKPSAEEAGMNLEALWRWTPRAKGTRTINQLRAAFPDDIEFSVVIFYACLKAQQHPPPQLQLWMDFGFCTCHIQEPFHWEERRLAAVYQQLFDKCTFPEFCQAFKTEGRDAIESIARRKGLGSALKDLESNGIYLKKPGPYSCFMLKQYIAINDPQQEPFRTIAWDYGYFGCRDARDKALWKTTYTKLFQNPNHRDLELHKACTTGKIFEYVCRILPDTPEAFRRLCKNVYPLRDPGY